MKCSFLAMALVPLLSIAAAADYLVVKVDVNKVFLGVGDSKQGRVLSSVPRKDHKGGHSHPHGPGGLPKGGGLHGGMHGMPGGFPKGSGGIQPGGGFPTTPGGGQQMPQGSQKAATQPPMFPGQANPKGQTGKNVDTTPPRWAYAYLELRGRIMPIFTIDQVSHIAIEHPWGKQCVVPIENILYIQQDSTASEFTKRAKALSKQGKVPAQLLRLAQWALAHGLMKEFHATMDDLSKSSAIPPPVKAAHDAYLKVKERLKTAPSSRDPAQSDLISDLKGENYQAIPSPQAANSHGHYDLLSNLSTNTSEAVQRRLALLEETYAKFFYWFALRTPESLPAIPGHKLLAVLVASPKEFHNKHVAWGSLPLVGDGFLPRRDNVLVMSAEHLDETYGLLKKNNQSYYQSLRMGSDELLSGSVWKRPDALQNDLNVALLQTMTLVEKATEEQAELATISHEATRQLLFATGLLPRNVAVPEWIQYGLSSFFETPPGAFFPGLGIPSWSNLVDFKYHRRKGKLGLPSDVLLQIVTDRYFQRARDSAARYADSADHNENLANKAREDQELARATSWAFVYYLIRENKLSYLKNYCVELDQLPRDLFLGDRILRACFARAFDLGDSSHLHHHLEDLADPWFAEMDNYVLDIPQYEQYILRARMEGVAPATTPKSGHPHAGHGGHR